MAELSLGKAAAKDIEDIAAYSAAHFGAVATVDYLAGLREAFQRLLDQPGVGARRDDLAAGIRSLRFRSHRIYYCSDLKGTRIIRVLHYARQVRRDVMQ